MHAIIWIELKQKQRWPEAIEKSDINLDYEKKHCTNFCHFFFGTFKWLTFRPNAVHKMRRLLPNRRLMGFLVPNRTIKNTKINARAKIHFRLIFLSWCRRFYPKSAKFESAVKSWIQIIWKYLRYLKVENFMNVSIPKNFRCTRISARASTK